jgi:hypothetical protein
MKALLLLGSKFGFIDLNKACGPLDAHGWLLCATTKTPPMFT